MSSQGTDMEMEMDSWKCLQVKLRKPFLVFIETLYICTSREHSSQDAVVIPKECFWHQQTLWVVCQGRGISAAYRKRLKRSVKMASSIPGWPGDWAEVERERRIRVIAMLSRLMESMSHLMQDTLTALGGSSCDRLLWKRDTAHPSFLLLSHITVNTPPSRPQANKSAHVQQFVF